MDCSSDAMTYCGFIAIVGRPNVGKSTLMNRLIQQKISITSRKPQTTRHRIVGIHTENPYQWIYVDTPGMTLNNPKNLNRVMNQTAQNSLSDVDAIVFVVDSYHWTDADEWVLSKIKQSKAPCFLVINKLDNIKDKRVLLPILDQMQARHNFQAMIPLAAKTGKHVEVLQDALKSCLPASPYLYDSEQVTDRNLRFMCS